MNLFHEVHPARAAACHHGQSAFLREALQQFAPLFHDGDVGPPIDVADVVRAHHL